MTIGKAEIRIKNGENNKLPYPQAFF